MKRDKSDLELLFDTVDNWFSDKAYTAPLCSDAESTLDKDQAKLAQISKTTQRWFDSLTNALTDDGIHEHDIRQVDICSNYNTNNSSSSQVTCEPKVVTKRNTKESKPRLAAGRRKSAPRNEQNIDKLAKDLERILEQEDEVSSPTPARLSIEYFNIYYDNELALLDESIGASYTLVQGNNNSTANQASKWSNLTDNSKLIDNKLSPPRIRKKSRKYSETQSQLKSNQDLRKVQTPCLLLDHDYLPKVPVKPLVLNNRLIQCSRQTQIEMPVLNISALRKFARFSHQFRRISMEHDKILAICNE